MAHVTFTKPLPRVLVKRFQKLEAERQKRESLATVRKRDGGKCRACGKPGNQVHHLLYRSHGGKNEPSNLIYVCARCHQEIHAKVTLVTFNPKAPAKSVKFSANPLYARERAVQVSETRR